MRVELKLCLPVHHKSMGSNDFQQVKLLWLSFKHGPHSALIYAQTSKTPYLLTYHSVHECWQIPCLICCLCWPWCSIGVILSTCLSITRSRAMVYPFLKPKHTFSKTDPLKYNWNDLQTKHLCCWWQKLRWAVRVSRCLNFLTHLRQSKMSSLVGSKLEICMSGAHAPWFKTLLINRINRNETLCSNWRRSPIETAND